VTKYIGGTQFIDFSQLSGVAGVAQGGTGATTVAGAQSNLGLGTLATLNSASLTSNVSGTLPTANGGTGNTTGVATNVSGTVAVANGGTGATSASAALTALGAASTAVGTTATPGLVQMSTNATTITGTSTNTAVTPATLANAFYSVYAHIGGTVKTVSGTTFYQSATAPGWYYFTAAQCSAMTDAPLNLPNDNFFLEVSPNYNGTDFKQILHRDSVNSQDMYVRTVNTGGYSGWHQVIYSVDVGWTNFTYASGFTAGSANQLRYSIQNGIMFIEGGATGTFVSGSYTNVTTATASNLWPSVTIHWGGTGQSGKHMFFQYTTAGIVSVAWNNLGTATTAPAWGSGMVAFPVDA